MARNLTLVMVMHAGAGGWLARSVGFACRSVLRWSPGRAPQDGFGRKEMLIMPLHEREVIRHRIEDCVFADRDLTRPVAKYRFPRRERCPGTRSSWWPMS
jgi:hypothetical protein